MSVRSGAGWTAEKKAGGQAVGTARRVVLLERRRHGLTELSEWSRCPPPRRRGDREHGSGVAHHTLQTPHVASGCCGSRHPRSPDRPRGGCRARLHRRRWIVATTGYSPTSRKERPP
jgi:hypothetical protein